MIPKLGNSLESNTLKAQSNSLGKCLHHLRLSGQRAQKPPPGLFERVAEAAPHLTLFPALAAEPQKAVAEAAQQCHLVMPPGGYPRVASCYCF